MTSLRSRDPADLLAERRATIREMDALDLSTKEGRRAKSILWYGVQFIDLELDRRGLLAGMVA
jgi:hypothetical protein